MKLSSKVESAKLYLWLCPVLGFGKGKMLYSIVQFVILVEDKFVRAPGHEREEAFAFPGEESAAVLVEGTSALLNTGFVTLLVLPVVAAILYASGYRVAGPLLGLFTLGLFLARIFGAAA